MHYVRFLKKIRWHGLSLNSKKCSFHVNSIDFLGFTVSNGKLEPSKERVAAVENYELPGDLKSLERFIGMATYFSKFIPNFSNAIRPIQVKKQCLLQSYHRKCNPTIDVWEDAEKKSFYGVKDCLKTSMLCIPTRYEKLILRTDASHHSIAAVLMTESGQPVSFMSRTLSKCEVNYDIVEKEALAIYWSIQRSKLFLMGRKFVVYSDHKPLQYLFNNNKVSPKLIRWRLALQAYDFEVKYCKGDDNVAADCFSRICSMEANDDLSPLSIEHVINQQEHDDETQQMIIELSENTGKKPKNVSKELWNMRKTLIVKNHLLYDASSKLFVPYNMRLKLLTCCHGLHRGIDATYNSVKLACFWPGCKSQVSEFVKTCRICSLVKPTSPIKSNSKIITKAPMEVLAMDFIGPLPSCGNKKYMLTMVDVYSRMAFVKPLCDLSAQTLISACKDVFCLTGFPNCVLSDRGAQFTSSIFRQFLNKFNVKQMLTNAYSPQNNGCCERFNGTLQKLIFSYLTQHGLQRTKWIEALPYALLNYRTTVHSSTNFRPVDLFYDFKVVGFSPVSNELNVKKVVPHKPQVIAKNLGFREGQEVLVKSPFKSKFSPKGKIAILAKVLNLHSVKVRYQDLKTEIVHISRVSYLPPLSNDDLTLVEDDSEENFASHSYNLRPRKNIHYGP